MRPVLDILEQWCPSFTSNQKKRINEYVKYEETAFKPLLDTYLELMDQYNTRQFFGNDTRLASGLVFFYGCVLYTLQNKEWSDKIPMLFRYNVLYLLVDYTIDDTNIKIEDKEVMVRQMSMLVRDPKLRHSMNLCNPILNIIAKIYEDLLEECPNIKKGMIELFKAEQAGAKIQKSRRYGRSCYHSIARKKGSTTMLVLADITGGSSEQLSDIGVIMQLIDDCLDVNMDMDNKIHTIATHDLTENGNLDVIWYEILNRIDHLNISTFKVVYSIFAVYVISSNPANYSSKLISKIKPYFVADFDAEQLIMDSIITRSF